MQSTVCVIKKNQSHDEINNEQERSVDIRKIISAVFQKIAPCWPLKNLIAVNPLRGFEDLSFQQAMEESMILFQSTEIPTPLHSINRETIKWCQAFFDDGQATIRMPLREQGLYPCFKQLALFDKNLYQKNNDKRDFILGLSANPEQAIVCCLEKLNIKKEFYSEFLFLLLTTLPGWASYVSYKTEWSQEKVNLYPVTQVDYLAMRIIITYLMWPNACDLYDWYKHRKAIPNSSHTNIILEEITHNENYYRNELIKSVLKNRFFKASAENVPLKAQLIFCIDVRSEPTRRTIEAKGGYETFGFAGFFGIPVQIKNEIEEYEYASCPALLSAKHTVNENIFCEEKLKNKILKKKFFIKTVKQSYQMLKYMFTTPFMLVEIMGLWCGLWMFVRTITPITAKKWKKKLLKTVPVDTPIIPLLDDASHHHGISFNEQCFYAENFLRMIGLTKNFAPFILILGHGAETENNAYQTALDCGACGGHNGAPNARILATILNNHNIRMVLAKKNIVIPNNTLFIAGMHNTTINEIKLYTNKTLEYSKSIQWLESDLSLASANNKECQIKKRFSNHINIDDKLMKSSDWGQTRPEWGLAKNASFIVGPRHITKDIDLHGRAFLHSYDWEQDKEGLLLTTILTAPMIVAQWINYQYLFSTLDNVAYGSGSKITHNITGEIGIIQGNASDLMNGLPLQSVYKNDKTKYHEATRLLTLVYAPRSRIANIILHEVVLQKLFRNRWISLICYDSTDGQLYLLSPDLQWQRYDYPSMDTPDRGSHV